MFLRRLLDSSGCLAPSLDGCLHQCLERRLWQSFPLRQNLSLKVGSIDRSNRRLRFVGAGKIAKGVSPNTDGGSHREMGARQPLESSNRRRNITSLGIPRLS